MFLSSIDLIVTVSLYVVSLPYSSSIVFSTVPPDGITKVAISSKSVVDVYDKRFTPKSIDCE